MTFHFEPQPIGAIPAFDLSLTAAQRALTVQPDLETAFLARGEAENNLRQLLTPGSYCVTTGQQPLLLLGPLFTVYKALSTAAVAAKFSAELGKPVIPVFWVGGDDHDFAEMNHVFIPGRDASVQRVELRQRVPADPLTPAYREPVGNEINELLRKVIEAQPRSEFIPHLERWLGAAYRTDTNLADAFAEALAELLGRFGVVVLKSWDEVVKRAAAPLLEQGLNRASEIQSGLERRATELKREGQRIPVKVNDPATTVMIEGSLGRDRLTLGDDGGFVTRRSGELFTLDQLSELLRSDPSRFSGNVLLRPVIEAGLLPTLAYLGGGVELAYLPQSDPIYETLEIMPQLRLPRWAGRVIEHRVQKTLDKYGITADDLEGSEGRLETDLVKDRLSPDTVTALERVADAIETQYDNLGREAVRIDSTLERSVESARNTTLATLKRLENKILRHLKDRDETLVAQLMRARNELFPAGKPQERVFGVIPYLARHGDRFLDSVFAECLEWAAALEPSARTS